MERELGVICYGFGLHTLQKTMGEDSLQRRTTDFLRYGHGSRAGSELYPEHLEQCICGVVNKCNSFWVAHETCLSCNVPMCRDVNGFMAL
jgi:hypothetical protein